MPRPVFLFVHGAWHGAWVWEPVLTRLQDRGCAAVAIDLPGAGAKAINPASFDQTPLDETAFATERTASAAVTQSDRTAAICAAIDAMEGEVILVGHSLGGLSITHAAEARSARIAKLVYVSGMMLAPGVTANAAAKSPSFAKNQGGAFRVGDPAVIGVVRINPRSSDPAYQRGLREVFYETSNGADWDACIARLHCDEPSEVRTVPSPATAQKFGRIERHFIRLRDDLAMSFEAQSDLIAAMDRAPGMGATRVHDMGGGHSPMATQPDAFTELLLDIQG